MQNIQLFVAVIVLAVVFIWQQINLHFARSREDDEEKKWESSNLYGSAGGGSNLSALIAEIKTYRKTSKTANRQNEKVALWTIMALFAAGIFAFFQWQTLDKTDHTLRAGERAFVFPRLDQSGWQPAVMLNNQIVRGLFFGIENSGNSPTKNMILSLYCPRPNAFDTIDPITAGEKPTFVVTRLLGPKQTQWAGICNYTASELENVRSENISLFVAFHVAYDDIFDESHTTEFCTKITDFRAGDFKSLSYRPDNDFTPCEKHNCADEECKNG